MNILGIVGSIFGIGKNYLKNRSELKKLKAQQEHEIIKAETEAIVNRIRGNSESDNEIDIITARNKKKTLKDEFITYLFLIPIVIASVTPFILAYDTNGWLNMNDYIRESYKGLDLLPNWYKYVIGAIVIDVLGFRSFARKLFDMFMEKKFGKNEKRD